MKKHYECSSCDASFNVTHDLDPHYYTIHNCPFCGESLNIDEDGFDLEDDAEDE